MIVPIPYFTGANDPSDLRTYLNQLVRFVNALAYILSQFQDVRTVDANSTPLSVQGTDGTIQIDLSAGSFNFEFTPALTTSQEIRFVVINQGDGARAFQITQNSVAFGAPLTFTGQVLRVQSNGNDLIVVGQVP